MPPVNAIKSKRSTPIVFFNVEKMAYPKSSVRPMTESTMSLKGTGSSFRDTLIHVGINTHWFYFGSGCSQCIVGLEILWTTNPRPSTLENVAAILRFLSALGITATKAPVNVDTVHRAAGQTALALVRQEPGCTEVSIMEGGSLERASLSGKLGGRFISTRCDADAWV